MKTLSAMIALVLALVLAACSMSKPSADSKSNWLRTCSSKSDCDDELSCLCGVCTRSCDDNAVCAGEALAARCTNVTAQSIAAACASAAGPAAAESRVCLASCAGADCDANQRCVQGVCVGKRDVDGGTLLGNQGDASLTGDSGAIDGQPIPGFDPDASVDASVPLCSEGSSQRECCAADGRCDSDLLCHVDDSCIASGELDEQGRATLQAGMPYKTRPFAADDAFVYGVYGGFKPPYRLVRWPIAGGDAEVLVDSLVLPDPPALIADDSRLYFVGSATLDDLGYSLWSMPKDGSTEPESSGAAGSLLVQNATHLYFTNDGNSRVERLAKSALGTASAREEVFTSSTDAPSTISSLAINSSTLFIAETPPPPPNFEPPATFTVRTFNLASSDVATLAEGTRFSVRPAPLLLANDSYLLLFNDAVDRFDLTTLEVKPLFDQLVGGSNTGLALAGDHLFVPSADGADDITLSASHRERITLSQPLQKLVPSANDLFGIVFTGTMPQTNLIRVAR